MGGKGGTGAQEPPEAPALFPGGAFIFTLEALRKSNTSPIPSDSPTISMVRFLWRGKTKREQGLCGDSDQQPCGKGQAFGTD